MIATLFTHYHSKRRPLALLFLTLALTACGGDSSNPAPAGVSAREGVVVVATAAGVNIGRDKFGRVGQRLPAGVNSVQER